MRLRVKPTQQHNGTQRSIFTLNVVTKKNSHLVQLRPFLHMYNTLQVNPHVSYRDLQPTREGKSERDCPSTSNEKQRERQGQVARGHARHTSPNSMLSTCRHSHGEWGMALPTITPYTPASSNVLASFRDFTPPFKVNCKFGKSCTRRKTTSYRRGGIRLF